MARFTKAQKKTIEHALITNARNLFQLYGYQKTSIQDITKEVGIAQGTFYQFFSSKAELYFTLLIQEEEKIRKQLLQMIPEQAERPQQYLTRVIRKAVFTLENNRLLSELMLGDNLKRMIDSLPEETISQHITNDETTLLAIMNHWQSLGISLTTEPALTASLLRSLFLLTTHKQAIGTELYKETIELLINSIVEKIVQEESS